MDSSENSNPIIEWRDINGIRCLFFTFSGIFRKADADMAVRIWKAMFSDYPDRKFNIVWQCLAMENYEGKARKVWQETMKELKEQISMVWLVTDSVLIQAGAEIMIYFVFYDMKVVKSLDELQRKIQKQLS